MLFILIYGYIESQIFNLDYLVELINKNFISIFDDWLMKSHAKEPVSERRLKKLYLNLTKEITKTIG